MPLLPPTATKSAVDTGRNAETDAFADADADAETEVETETETEAEAGAETQAQIQTQKRASIIKIYAETCLRVIQFIFSLVVIGLYGHDIQPSAQSLDSRWVYAVVVGFISALTAFVYVLQRLFFVRPSLLLLMMLTRGPVACGTEMKGEKRGRRVRRRKAMCLAIFVWEDILAVNWVVVSGIFGKMFIVTDGSREMAVATATMRHAAYLDLTILGLFLGSAVWVGMRWWKVSRADDAGEGEFEKGAVTAADDVEM